MTFKPPIYYRVFTNDKNSCETLLISEHFFGKFLREKTFHRTGVPYQLSLYTCANHNTPILKLSTGTYTPILWTGPKAFSNFAYYTHNSPSANTFKRPFIYLKAVWEHYEEKVLNNGVY